VKRYISTALLAGFLIAQLPFGAMPVQAAVSSWQKSASIIPQWSGDFSSESFKQSLRNLKADGATYVNLIIPYYQSNPGSTDIQRGGNTPSDASLVSAIQYAHSIGLKVSIALYLETFSNEWRAYINPGDRDGWYRNYGNTLVYYGRIAQQQGVERFVLGAELISMASTAANADNTQRWNTMIANVRAVYSGTLTYSANRSQGDNWGSEAANIGFWDKLDLIGLSMYYESWGDGSVESMKANWENINNTYIRPLQQRIGKPVIFTEIGFRSVSGAHTQPWNSGMGGPYDAQEQVRDYTALFEYWNTVSFVQGVDLWWWKSDPNAGGQGDTDYTVQNKPAEAVVKQWWTSGGTTQPPPPSGPVTFTTTGSANPSNANVGQQVSVTANVTQTSGSSSGIIVDMEVYQGSTKVYQTFQGGQSFTQGQTKPFTASFTPNSAGTYTFKIGVFNSDWSQNYTWNNSAATITVGNTTQPPTTNPPPPSGSKVTEIWWPTDGSHVTGVQPFKAMVQGLDISQYTMYWQVDNGGRVQMSNSTQDYPHKEALVDLSGWRWKGAGPYTITFTSTDSSNATISTKSINIFTQ
jgi:hypothetical protein